MDMNEEISRARQAAARQADAERAARSRRDAADQQRLGEAERLVRAFIDWMQRNGIEPKDVYSTLNPRTKQVKVGFFRSKTVTVYDGWEIRKPWDGTYDNDSRSGKPVPWPRARWVFIKANGVFDPSNISPDELRRAFVAYAAEHEEISEPWRE
jgi:hypothetical protein